MSSARSSATLDLSTPYMHPDEVRMYARYLNRASRVCEFGSGASTAFALRAGIQRIVSIESDAAWLDSLLRDAAIHDAVAGGMLHLMHADIGPVERWGFPAGRENKAQWHAYPEAPWTVWEKLEEAPDLILVDGRFRIACCLRSLQWWLDIRRSENVIILLHDVNDKRPGYRVAFDWLDLEERVGSLCAFRPRVPLDPHGLARAYAKALTTAL